jgi:hypothetical protein
MNSVQSWKLRFSPLAEIILGRALVEPFMEISRANDAALVVASSYGEFKFDLKQRVVLRDGVVVAGFDAVQSVDIASFPGGRGSRSWSVSLYLSPFNRITIGRSYDDADTSVIAAKLAAAVGCKVLSLIARM